MYILFIHIWTTLTFCNINYSKEMTIINSNLHYHLLLLYYYYYMEHTTVTILFHWNKHTYT